jgi:simple sugar transport system permease protein
MGLLLAALGGLLAMQRDAACPLPTAIVPGIAVVAVLLSRGRTHERLPRDRAPAHGATPSRGRRLLSEERPIHIGTEGTMLVGAFVAFLAGLKLGDPHLALLLALVSGLACGAVFALASVAGRTDPILVGTAWNLVAAGGTAFAYRLAAGPPAARTRSHAPTPLRSAWAVLVAFLVPVAIHVFVKRTRPGLALVAAGETPEALEAQGLSTVRVRSSAAIVSGALAAGGGGLLVLTVSPTFVEGVTSGRGFLALALVVFARWKPLLLLPAALLLGGANALQYRFQATGSTIPYAFFLAIPPLVALVALALSRGRAGRRGRSARRRLTLLGLLLVRRHGTRVLTTLALTVGPVHPPLLRKPSRRMSCRSRCHCSRASDALPLLGGEHPRISTTIMVRDLPSRTRACSSASAAAPRPSWGRILLGHELFEISERRPIGLRSMNWRGSSRRSPRGGPAARWRLELLLDARTPPPCRAARRGSAPSRAPRRESRSAGGRGYGSSNALRIHVRERALRRGRRRWRGQLVVVGIRGRRDGWVRDLGNLLARRGTQERRPS